MRTTMRNEEDMESVRMSAGLFNKITIIIISVIII